MRSLKMTAMLINSKNQRGEFFLLAPLLLLLLISFWAPLSFAQEGTKLEERVHAFTMKNGIRVLILERHISPTVSFLYSYQSRGGG